MNRPFEARYGGVCGVCTERFPAGSPVQFIDDEVCHVDCDERQVAGKTETVCARCFLTACDCGADS